MENRLPLILIPLWLTLIYTPILIAQETFAPPKGIIAQIGKGQVADVQSSGENTLSFDNTLRLWNTTTGKAKKIIKEHKGWVESIAFSPDGKMIASGSKDGTVRLWNSHTGAKKRVIRLSNTKPIEENEAIREFGMLSMEIIEIAFSPDGKTIAAAAYDPNIYLWDVDTGERLSFPYTHKTSIVAIAFSPDGKLLVIADVTGIMKIYDVSAKKLLRLVKIGDGRVEDLEFVMDGTMLVSLCSGVITLWDMTP